MYTPYSAFLQKPTAYPVYKYFNTAKTTLFPNY